MATATGAGAIRVVLTEQGFRKMSRARWHARAKKNGTLAADYRGMDFKKAKEDIGKKHQGESKREYRERLIGLCSKAGRSGQRAYMKMTEENKRRFVTAFREDEYHVEKISREPDYVPQYVNTPFFLDAGACHRLCLPNMGGRGQLLFVQGPRVQAVLSQHAMAPAV